MSLMAEQRREFYRVEFPEHERPVLFLNEIFYEVLDICEAGLRFEVDGTPAFAKLVSWLIAVVIFYIRGTIL